MFTGLIEEIGQIKSVQPIGEGKRFEISVRQIMDDIKVDDSIAVNGCCLTVVKVTVDSFTAEAVEESLKKTTIGKLKTGAKVNLERAMKMSDRLGGHLVLGHVDGIGLIKSIQQRTASWWMGIQIPESFERYCIPVGSIAIDGISLTIAEIQNHVNYVSVIPHTWSHTVLSLKNTGDEVNIETDMIGKYVEKYFRADKQKQAKPMTEERLKELGY
jgi:riboflavin synthase